MPSAPLAASSVTSPAALEDVAGEAQVLLVVVHDEHDGIRHRGHTAGCAGRVKRNVLPSPRALSTQSRPPWSSMNLRASGRPRPVPSAGRPDG